MLKLVIDEVQLASEPQAPCGSSALTCSPSPGSTGQPPRGRGGQPMAKRGAVHGARRHCLRGFQRGRQDLHPQSPHHLGARGAGKGALLLLPWRQVTRCRWNPGPAEAAGEQTPRCALRVVSFRWEDLLLEQSKAGDAATYPTVSASSLLLDSMTSEPRSAVTDRTAEPNLAATEGSCSPVTGLTRRTATLM